MNWPLTAVLAAEVAAAVFFFCARPRVARRALEKRRGLRPQPLPPGLPRDGAPLTWRETVAWNEILRGYGREPARDGGQRRAAE